MKKYSHIAQLIYKTPWLILPSTHKEISTAFEKHIQSVGFGSPDKEVFLFRRPDKEDEEDETKPGVIGNTMVINITGPIGKRLGFLETCFGGYDIDWLTTDLQLAMATPEVENIILHFDSPGGSVTGTEEAGEMIAEIAKTKNVIAYTDTLMASAAYWLASQADAIYASKSSQIGSVGVYMALMDATRAYEREGLKPEVFSAGKYKTMGADFRAITDEERVMLQSEVNEIYEQFKATVLSKRTIKDEDLQGQTFNGLHALEKGFIDGIANHIGELLALCGTDDKDKNKNK